MRHRYAADEDMGLENSASASKIIRVETLRSEFGLDLTYENLGQRVTGTPCWRGGMDSEFCPLEESASHQGAPVFKNEFIQLGALPLAEGEGVRSTLLQWHMNLREKSCLVHENHDV